MTNIREPSQQDQKLVPGLLSVIMQMGYEPPLSRNVLFAPKEKPFREVTITCWQCGEVHQYSVPSSNGNRRKYCEKCIRQRQRMTRRELARLTDS